MSASERAPSREWSEVVLDWVTEQPIEVRFRSEGGRVWVWSPMGDGLDPDPLHEWVPLTPRSRPGGDG